MARNYTGRRMGNPNESEQVEGGGNALRIDRWLWCTRLFKSRTLAAEAVAGGKVHVNGRRVKPALGVHVGDHVTITRPGYEFECEILKLPDRRGSAPMAQACYSETDAARASREKYADKHGRRELRRLRGRDS
jgi:ribosome-associated heat shock protein Hsp15